MNSAAASCPDDIAAAVDRLRAGGLVAFATETVYGLGADAGNAAAVRGIFAAKGRPADHPLIVHIADSADMAHWAAELPSAAIALASAFWPGPLTLILRRAAHVADAVTGGQDTVGLRCPSHPLARQLLAACRAAGILGVAAPSANRFGRVSPTTVAHVRAEFGDDLMILDGGPCAVGIESTIVDVSGGGARVLRPGMIAAGAIAACVSVATPHATDVMPRVPGALASHYAPSTPLVLLGEAELVRRAVTLTRSGKRVAVVATPATLRQLTGLPHLAAMRSAAHEPADYARELYAALRELDASEADAILIETPPAADDWEAIRDRLARAAAGAGRHTDPP